MITQRNNNIIIVIWDSPSRHHRHLCSAGCPGHYRMVSSILGFYSPGHNSPPPRVATAKNVSRYCQMCWGRGGGYKLSTWLSNLLAQTWLKTTGLCERKRTLFFLNKESNRVIKNCDRFHNRCFDLNESTSKTHMFFFTEECLYHKH